MPDCQSLLHPLAAAAGEHTVTAELALFNGFLYVLFFCPCMRGYIKINHGKYYNIVVEIGQK